MSAQTPNSLVVLFDEDCAFCLRVMAWIQEEPTFVPLELVPMRAAIKTARFQELAPLVAAGKFIVVSDDGSVYLDTRARIMILYALKKYRSTALTFSAPGLYSMVDVFFNNLSKSRHAMAQCFDENVTKDLHTQLCHNNTCEIKS